jgi:transcriptional regulator with XRE-family HTH domain
MAPANNQSYTADEIQFINNVGYRIQYLRKKQGLSQDDLAKKTGLSVATIFSIERKNQRGLSMITFLRIAKGLDVSPSALFDFK